MPDLQRSIQRAVQLADRLGETEQRDRIVAALGSLWTQERLNLTSGPALQTALAGVLRAVEGCDETPGLEALVSCVEDIERFVSARAPAPPVGPATRRAPMRATHGRPALHAAPTLPFVAKRADDLDEDFDVVEPTDEELEGGPVAPDDWYAQEEEPPQLEPFPVDASLEKRMGMAVIDLAEPPPPRVVLGDGGEPLSREALYAEIVASCAENIAARGRDRVRLPWTERAHAERRMLEMSDAFAASGPARLAALVSWWQQARDGGQGWATWATVFLLGCTAGEDAAIALVQCTLALEPDDRSSVILAAEALGICPHPELAHWAVGWASSAHPVERALGIDVLSRHGRLAPDAIGELLDDESPLVAEFAVRALERLGVPSEAMVVRLRRHLSSGVFGLAWRAARLLTLAKDERPYEELVGGGELRKTLGASGLEIFILRGRMQDRSELAACHRHEKPTPYVLDALARFGHPETYRFLCHFLMEEELAESADQALAVLYGERLAPNEKPTPAAWQAAIERSGFAPNVRLRRGQPWSPAVAAEEVREGRLTEGGMRTRVDELIMATNDLPHIDLSAWGVDAAVVARLGR